MFHFSRSRLFFLKNSVIYRCSSNSSIRRELNLLFFTSASSNLPTRIPLRDLTGHLSDDAFEELGDESLKDWIANNMKSDLEIFRENGLFFVSGKSSSKNMNNNRHSDLRNVLFDAPPAPVDPHEAKQLKKQQNISENNARKGKPNNSAKNNNIVDAINSAPPPPPTSIDDLGALPAPDLWIQSAQTKSSNFPTAVTEKKMQQAKTVNGKKILFCLPIFVVPLCHETMDILEEQIGRMFPAAEEGYFRKISTNTRDASTESPSPLQRFKQIFGDEKSGERDAFFSSSNFEIDEFGAELVKLESFAPTRQNIDRWISEEEDRLEKLTGSRKITRVDNLIPESIHLRGAAGMPDQIASGRNSLDNNNNNNNVGLEPDEIIDIDEASTAGIGGGGGRPRDLNALPVVNEVLPSSSLVPEFELPNWIAEHDATGNNNNNINNSASSSSSSTPFRYFFRLSPIYHSDKEAMSQQLLANTLNALANPVSAAENPYFNDSVFSQFQVLEFDAFRLARCLPASGTSISLKSLVVGGVLNVLSVPDVQFVITAFPELFEYPVKFANEKTNSQKQQSSEDQAVRFILAGGFEKPVRRSPTEIRAEIESLGDTRRSNRIDPKTGQKMRGGQWMRWFDKANRLNKELALAMNPGAHPMKDPRVLAQLLFDMLPTDQPVELAVMHRRLKSTAVQLGESLDVAFFRKYPHMFHTVELGNVEKFGIVRVDATITDNFLLNPVASDENQMWIDMFAVYRKLCKKRQTVAFSLLTTKVPTGSRMKMEEMILALTTDSVKKEERRNLFKRKVAMIGFVFLEEIGLKNGIFVQESQVGNECFVKINPRNPIVQKYMSDFVPLTL